MPDDGLRASAFEIPEPDLQPTPKWAANFGALEEKNWSALDETRQKNDVAWLRVYGFVLVAMTVVFAGLFGASLCFWAWHHLMPDGWHWLSADQLDKIKSVLFSGGMGAIVSSVVQSQIAKASHKS